MYLEKSVHTKMGHLDQESARIRSTKNTLPVTKYPLKKETSIPEQDPRNIQTHKIYMKVEEITGKIYMYHTGRFPVKSSLVNRYSMALYDYDSNAILTRAMKNQQNKKR